MLALVADENRRGERGASLRGSSLGTSTESAVAASRTVTRRDMASDTMTLRWKIVVLAIVPLLVATGVVAREVFRRANRLSEQQVSLIEQSLREQKRQELMHAVTIVESQ